MSYQRARERQSRQNNYNTSELGTVTSSGKEINALGVGEYREVPLVAPFGIRWNPPSGANVQLIKNWHMGSNIVAVGTIVDEEIPHGEVELYSKGGAKLRLKNDGTVIVNDKVTISKEGKVKAIDIEISNNMRIKSNGDVVINNVIITTDGSIKVPNNADVGKNINVQGNSTIYGNADVTGIVTASDFIRR